MTHIIHFEPVGRRGEASPDGTLLDAARELGVDLVSVCGGSGTCGQCRVQVVTGEVSEPTASESEHLSAADLTEGDRTVFIRRLIYHNAQRVLLHREHVVHDPLRPTVESEMEVTALRGLFSGRGGSDFKRGDLVIDVTKLRVEEAALLQAGVGSPAFRLEHIFYDFEDRPVSWGWFICSGERLRFTGAIGVRE